MSLSLTSIANAEEEKTKNNLTQENPKTIKPTLQGNEHAILLTDKYIRVNLQKVDSAFVNDVCTQKSKKTCLALKAFQGKKNTEKNPQQNPAAGYCALMKGENYIAENATGNQNDLCKFKDGSYILSWDLYLKHYPIPVIK